jgi:non-heme chloroperoxidase
MTSTTRAAEGSDAETRFFTSSDGVRLAVREHGNKDGRPLLFIHGFMGGTLSWETVQRSVLASDFRLVSIDLRGHGDSDKPQNPASYASSQQWADDLAAIIDGLGLSDVVLVAHSYGGVVAMDYVRHAGLERIGGVFFVAAAAEAPGCDPSHFHLATLQLLGPIPPSDLPHRVGLVQAFVRSLTSTPLPAQSFERLLAQAMVSTPLMLAGAFTRAPQSNADILSQLTCPVAFVVGEHENVITSAMTTFVKSKIPHLQEIVYPGVGHLPHVEAAPAFTADLAKFAGQPR